MAPFHAWHDATGPLDASVVPPTGSGPRWILSQIGSSATGLVREVGLLFSADGKKQDYHGNMDAQKFLEWLEVDVLPFIANFLPATLVVDRATYHTTLTPTSRPAPSTLRKAELQAWLREHHVDFDDHLSVKQLRTLASENKPKPVYEVVELAAQFGVDILFLPTAHPTLNPVEQCWARVKDTVARNNADYNMRKLGGIIKDALDLLTADVFETLEKHCIDEEDQYLSLPDVDPDDVIVEEADGEAVEDDAIFD